jgi:sec-independent protein translocase protein TatB
MFDIGWSELLVIAVVAIIVVGPKDLPRMMRTFGTYAGKLRRMAGDFQRQFEDAMREAEIEEVKKAMHSVRDELATPVDRPLMLPNQTPAANAAAPVDVTPVKAPQTRPKAKKSNKPKTTRTKTAKPKASRGKKP